MTVSTLQRAFGGGGSLTGTLSKLSTSGLEVVWRQGKRVQFIINESGKG